MADKIKYKEKVYNFLKNQASDFKRTPEDFYNQLKSNEYRAKVYKFIDDNSSDFTKTPEDFNRELDNDEIIEQPQAHFMLSPYEVRTDAITNQPLTKDEWNYVSKSLPPPPSITTPHTTTEEAMQEERKLYGVPELKNRYELFKKKHPTLGFATDIAKGSVMIPSQMYAGMIENVADAYNYSNKPTTEDLKHIDEKYRGMGLGYVPTEQFDEAERLKQEAQQGLIPIPKPVLESAKINLKNSGLDPMGVVSFALDKLSESLSPQAYTGAIALLKATNAAIEAAFVVGIGKGAIINPLAEALKLSALEALGMAFPTATEAVFSPVSVAMKTAGIPEPTRELGKTFVETGNLVGSLGAMHLMGKGMEKGKETFTNLKDKYTEYKTPPPPPPPSQPISPEPKYDAQAELKKLLQELETKKTFEESGVPKIEERLIPETPPKIEEVPTFIPKEQIKEEIPIGQKEKQIGIEQGYKLEDELRNRQVPKDIGVWRDKFNKSTKIFEKEKILMNVAKGSRNEKELNDVKVAAEGMPKEGNIIDAADATLATLKKQPVIKTQSETHKEYGGSTFNLSGKNLFGTKKTSVSIFPERTERLKEGEGVNEENLNKFKEKNKDLLRGNEDVLAVGTWFNEKTGRNELDIVVTLPHNEAIILGKKYNQIAVFNLETGEEIQIGGTGEVIKGLKPELERIKDIGARKTEEQTTNIGKLGLGAAALGGSIAAYSQLSDEDKKTANKVIAAGFLPVIFTAKGKEETKSSKKMLVTHNTNEGKIINYAKLEGYPRASLNVSTKRTDHFGQMTLIYDKNVLTKKKGVITDANVFDTDMFSPTSPDLTDGGKKFTSSSGVVKEATMGNLIEEMNNTPLLGGEEGAHFGGIRAIRAMLGKEFKTIKEIKQAKETLVTYEDFAKKRRDLAADYSDIIYDWIMDRKTNLIRNLSIDENSITKAVMNGIANNNIKKQLIALGIPEKDINMSQLNEFLGKLKQMPSYYFEAKAKGEVPFSDIKVAVVPENTSKEVLDILMKNNPNIEIVKYKSRDERFKLIEEYGTKYALGLAGALGVGVYSQLSDENKDKALGMAAIPLASMYVKKGKNKTRKEWVDINTERRVGESDIDYKKRLAKEVSDIDKLGSKVEDYFKKNPEGEGEGVKIDISNLKLTKEVSPQETKTAQKYLEFGYLGLIGKREFIKVRVNKDGSFEIVDGNETTKALQAGGKKYVIANIDVGSIREFIDHNYPKFREHQNVVNGIVNKYANGENFSGIMDVKSLKRITEKIIQEKLNRPNNNNIFETIKDIARQDLIVSDKNSIKSIFKKVLEDVERMGFTEVKTKITSKEKRYTDGYESNYIKFKNKNGVWGELQIVDIYTYAAKNGTYKLTNPKLIEKIKQIEKDVERKYGQPIPMGLGHWLYEVSRDKSLPTHLRKFADNVSKEYYGYYKNFNTPVAKKLSTKSLLTGSPAKNLSLAESYSSDVSLALSWETYNVNAVGTSSSSISRFSELVKKLNDSAVPSAKSHLKNIPSSVMPYLRSLFSSITEYNKKTNTKQDKSLTIFSPLLGAGIGVGIGVGAYNQLSDRDKNAINNILGKAGVLGGGLAIAGVLTGGERSKVRDILQKLGDKRPTTEIEKLSDKELIDTLRKVKEEISKSPIEEEIKPTEKTTRPPIIGKVPSTTKGYNERKIQPEAREEVIKFYEENPELIDKYRRGTISNKETIEEATKIAETISIEDINLLKSGDVKKAEDILAYRMVAQNELIKAVKAKQNASTAEEISTAEMNIVKAGIGISKVNALLTEAARGTQSGTIKIPYKIPDNTLVEITREAKEVLNNIDKVGESGRGLGVDLLGDIKYKLNSEQVEGVKLAIDELANKYEKDSPSMNEAKDLLKEILVDNEIDFTPENVNKLKKAINKIKNLKGKKAIAEILETHNKNPKAFDKFSFWFYNSILSNPITDFKNIIGNASNFAFEFIPRYLKADAVGKKRMRDNFWKGVEKGKIEAHRIYEGDIKDPSKFQEIATMEGKYDLHPTTKAGKTGRALLPTTRLAIEDSMFRSVAGAIELGEVKYETRDIFKDKLDRLDELIKEEMENVESGKGVGYRDDLSIEQNVKLKEILEGVNEFEKQLVYQSELGKFGKGSQQISNSNILAKIILPFVRIGINLAKISYEASPLGFTKLFGEKASKMSERERKHIIRRAKLGTLFYSALGVGMASGYVQVTGKLSRDKDKNEILNKLGYKPNHIYFGDRGFNYMNIAPFGYFLSLVGAVSDEYKYGRENDDYMEKFGSAVLASMESISDQSYLQGISRLTKAIRERDGSYFESLSTSFIPNIASFPRDVRDIYRGEKFDYEKEGLGDKIKYKFGMDESLTPKYNVWGEKKEVAYSNLPFPLAKFDKKGKELEVFLIENDFNVSKPSPSTYIGDRKMTTEEFSEYSKLVGLKTRDLLVNKFEGIKRVSKVSKERAQNIIDESTDIAKKIAKNKIINKNKIKK